MKEVKKGEVIINKDEESNFLYYIASGSYTVLDEKGDILNELTSLDVFIGEMSFLLNNRRTATVTAAEDGILYRVSKKNFTAAIQSSPYYSFFLCKLLARRLEKTNEKFNQFTKT